MNIDERLKDIAFYQYHPEYLPFIGEKFDEYRILHIGESHFLDQSKSDATISLKDLEGWWTGQENPKIAEQSKESNYTTRNIVNRYMNVKRTKAHGIFTNVARSFSENILGESGLSPEAASKNYKYFAFMNFFQQPSLYKGASYWEALRYATNEDRKKHPVASELWAECACHSARVLDAVIDILEPKLVIFTSKSATEAYRDDCKNGKHAKEKDLVIYTYHPGSPYWNRPGQLTENKTGREAFEDALKTLKPKG